MKDQTRQAHDQYARDVMRVSFMVAVVAIIGLGIYLLRRPTPPPVTVNQLAGLPVILTPQSYEDFVGPITVVSPDRLVVTMNIIDPAGQPQQRAYTVAVGNSTVLATSIDRATGPELKPAAFNDFRVGDIVQVFGTQNLYPLENFTATKVYKIISS